MWMGIRRILFSIVVLFNATTIAVAVEDLNPVSIEEWPVPWSAGRPRDPYVAPDKSVWFVGQQNHYIARFDPGSGKFTRHMLESGTGPHNLIVGSNGIVWFAGNRKGYIGRYDPVTQKTEKIRMPKAAARDPHTLVFDSTEKHIWFSVQGGNFVGRLNVATHAVDLIAVPTQNARPYGIIVAPNGVVWVALLGTNKLGSVDPVTLKFREHVLPDPDAAPRRLVSTSDGQIYYVDYARGFLGHLDPDTGFIREWPVPSKASAGPYAMAIDDMDHVWFVETGDRPNHLIGFSTRDKKFTSITAIPSGAGSVRHMVFHSKSGTLWFGTDANTLGRAQVRIK